MHDLTVMSPETMKKPLDQIRDETRIVKYLCQMIAESEESGAELLKQTRRNWHFLLGNHYLQEGPNNQWVQHNANPYWRTRLQRDILTPVVTTALSVLHKLKPTILIEADFPTEPVHLLHEGQMIPLPIDGSIAAGQLQRMMEAMWDERSEEVLQAELLLDIIVQGFAWRTFLPVQHGNSWKVIPRLLNSEQVLCDPDGTDLTNFEDFKYVVICEMMDVADIERIYHMKEKDFTRGMETSDTEGTPGFGEEDGLFREYAYAQTSEAGVLERVKRMQRRKYPVHTIYYHQGCPDVFSYGRKAPKTLNFPLGRQMTLINKKKLANDIHNPYWHKKFPLVCYQSTPLPHKNFGLSDISRLLPVQEMVNILQNMVLANAITLGVPQWMVEDGTVTEGDITNEPGAVIRVRPTALQRGAVQRMDPRPSQDDLYSHIRDLQSHAQEDLGGMSEAIKGQPVTSDPSGVLQNSALSAALTQFGFKAQMIDAGHKRAAALETSMVQQYLHLDTQMLMDHHEGGEFLEMNLAVRELFFDAKVESQAELPHNPQARLNLATHMLQMGYFDGEEFRRFTGLKVRPELERTLYEASKFFMPLVPLEAQAQIRTEYEIARLRARLAEAGIDPNAPQGAPQGGGGTEPINPAGRSGEEISGIGPGSSSGPAGSPNQRPL